MTFLWRDVLWLLLALPVLSAAYVLLFRRKKHAVRYTSLVLVRAATGLAPRWRFHVPPLLFILAIAALLIAAARPSAIVALPSEQRTIVLAIDVSYSMTAHDVSPSRLAAAQAAAKAFIRSQPADVLIGIVSFAGDADVSLRPTAARSEAVAAVDQLNVRYGTAIGNGIIASLMAIFPAYDIAGEYDIFGTGRLPLLPQRFSRNNPPRAQRPPVDPVAPASFSSAAIVLLTDGRETVGITHEKAARMAADRGIRVYTVGFGSAELTHAEIAGERMEVGFDEDALKTIAEQTGGTYFHADTAEDLHRVYHTLTSQVVLENKRREVTALLTGLGALLMLSSGGLSLAWWSRFA